MSVSAVLTTKRLAHLKVGLVRNPVRLSPTFCAKKMGDKLGQGEYPFEPQRHMLRMLKNQSTSRRAMS